MKPQVAQQKATMQHGGGGGGGGEKLTKEVPCLPQKKHLTVSCSHSHLVYYNGISVRLAVRGETQH